MKELKRTVELSEITKYVASLLLRPFIDLCIPGKTARTGPKRTSPKSGSWRFAHIGTTPWDLRRVTLTLLAIDGENWTSSRYPGQRLGGPQRAPCALLLGVGSQGAFPPCVCEAVTQADDSVSDTVHHFLANIPPLQDQAHTNSYCHVTLCCLMFR